MIRPRENSFLLIQEGAVEKLLDFPELLAGTLKSNAIRQTHRRRGRSFSINQKVGELSRSSCVQGAAEFKQGGGRGLPLPLFREPAVQARAEPGPEHQDHDFAFSRQRNLILESAFSGEWQFFPEDRL